MDPISAEPELAEPHLRALLSTVGLDVEYVRAAGNALYRRDDDGRETAVLDFAGGYGSLMFGHNHPRIIARARALLAEGTPVHAQFSRHPYANELALRLNRIMQRELGRDEPYFAIFANSGAEAVEAAIKHAEMDRGIRADTLLAGIESNLEAVRAQVSVSTVRLAPRVLDLFRGSGSIAHLRFDAANTGGAPGGGAGDDGGAALVDPSILESLTGEIVRHNDAQRARSPLFLSLEGALHGKLVGSVQLTHNIGYRAPFRALAAQARFLPPEATDILHKTIEEEKGTVLDLVIDSGVLDIVETPYPIFCAFVLEPIQGEGGINPLSEQFARDIQEVCAAIDCPIVIDEIQTGMGRTGAFLASSSIGLRGDYYVLAKSLGGGVAKAAVMLVRQARYRDAFELVHSSTFAKDSFSCQIALTVLDMLEEEDGRAYGVAVERGDRLAAMLDAVRADFPDVVRQIRGRGLMLGIEFEDQTAASSPLIRAQAMAGFLGYAIAGYLLRLHDIRTFPTASAVNTLRFEPSLLLTDTEIDRLEKALRAVCAVLRDQDGGRLLPAV